MLSPKRREKVIEDTNKLESPSKSPTNVAVGEIVNYSHEEADTHSKKSTQHSLLDTSSTAQAVMPAVQHTTIEPPRKNIHSRASLSSAEVSNSPKKLHRNTALPVRDQAKGNVAPATSNQVAIEPKRSSPKATTKDRCTTLDAMRPSSSKSLESQTGSQQQLRHSLTHHFLPWIHSTPATCHICGQSNEASTPMMEMTACHDCGYICHTACMANSEFSKLLTPPHTSNDTCPTGTCRSVIVSPSMSGSRSTINSTDEFELPFVSQHEASPTASNVEPCPAASTITEPATHLPSLAEKLSFDSEPVRVLPSKDFSRAQPVQHQLIHSLQSSSRHDSDKSIDSLGSSQCYTSQSLDDFEIDMREVVLGEKLGSGAYGDVYKGYWHGDVAVKFLKSDQLRKPDCLESWRNEVAILRRLRHDRIVLLMGISSDPSCPAIMMGYCEQRSLYDRLHVEEHVYSLATLLKVAKQIAEGLDYLHAVHIIHRDLKSKNILLKDGDEVKIADFGMASFKDVGSFLNTSNYMGSIYWLAPEIIRGTQGEIVYTEKSDVYAFGIILYELLANQLPHEGLQREHIIFNVGRYQQPDVSLCRDDSPMSLTLLMKRCWHAKTQERPTFAEILLELQEISQRLRFSSLRSRSDPNLLLHGSTQVCYYGFAS